MNIKEKFRFKVKVLLEQKLIIFLIILAKSHLVTYRTLLRRDTRKYP